MELLTHPAHHVPMAAPKQREPRRNVILRARMRANSDWCDVTICNVSSRGLMAKCAVSIAKGEYVEVRHRTSYIIGRIVWSHGMRFGIRTQDRIDIAALLSEATLPAENAGIERRSQRRDRPTPASKPDIAARAEASRQFARIFDWAILMVAAIVAGAFVFDAANTALKAPLDSAGMALSGRQTSN
jgi:hypothetical protein